MMTKCINRVVALLIAAAVLMLIPLPVFAENPPYSLSIQGRVISVTQSGAEVARYNAQNSDYALTANRSGLLFQFTNAAGKTTAIALGEQSDLQVDGTMTSLTVSSMVGSMTRLVTGADSKIGTLIIYAPMQAQINGSVTTLSVQGAASVDVPAAGSVTTAQLVHRQAALTASGTVKTVEKVTDATASGNGIGKITALSSKASNVGSVRSRSGLVLDNRDWRDDRYYDRYYDDYYYNDYYYDGYYDDYYNDRYYSSSSRTTTTNGSSIRLEAKTIYADYDDRLSELEDDLEDAVRAYTRSGGSRVYGDVYWVDEDDYADQTGYYSFYFEPDNRYSRVKGRIRIIVDDDDDDDRYSGSKRNIYFDIDNDAIYVSEDDDLQLRDLIDELESAVRVYDKDDDEVDGEFKWKSSSKRVKDTDYYDFTFTPDSSRYRKKTGRIKIHVN